MVIDPKGIIYYFSLHAFFLSPTERTHYYKTGFIKLQVIFSFLLFLFANVGGEPGNSGLNEISYTRCVRKVLGRESW